MKRNKLLVVILTLLVLSLNSFAQEDSERGIEPPDAYGQGGYITKFVSTSTNLENSSFYQASSGCIGLGTSIPLAEFSIDGSPLVDIMRVRYDRATKFHINKNGGISIGAYSSTLQNGNLYINSNVGINTMPSNYELDVNGDANISGNLSFKGTSRNIYYGETTSWGKLKISRTLKASNGTGVKTDVMIFDEDANVGIGMIDPEYKLDVKGDVNVDGNQYLKGNWTKLYYGGMNSWGKLTISAFLKGTNGTNATTNAMTFDERANVGIGTPTPSEKLHVKGNIKVDEKLIATDVNATRIYASSTVSATRLVALDDLISTNGHFAGDLGVEGTTIHNGAVGIGKAPEADNMLQVAGTASVQKLVVELQREWPDFVFEDSYEKQNLQEVESFIQKNKHLPGVPSAKKVKEEGIDVGQMNAILLQKIEELTLHLIEQQKQIEKLKQDNLMMHNSIKDLTD